PGRRRENSPMTGSMRSPMAPSSPMAPGSGVPGGASPPPPASPSLGEATRARVTIPSRYPNRNETQRRVAVDEPAQTPSDHSRFGAPRGRRRGSAAALRLATLAARLSRPRRRAVGGRPAGGGPGRARRGTRRRRTGRCTVGGRPVGSLAAAGPTTSGGLGGLGLSGLGLSGLGLSGLGLVRLGLVGPGLAGTRSEE